MGKQDKRDNLQPPGSGLPLGGGGTEAPSRSNLRDVEVNPPLGAGESFPIQSGSPRTTPAPLSSELALRPRSGIMTGGCPGDGWERGEAGSLKSGAPQSSASLLAAELANHRRAMRHAKDAIEAIILKLHIEDRTDLAVALCELTHVLNGGVL